jgi:hypothetical protein
MSLMYDLKGVSDTDIRITRSMIKLTNGHQAFRQGGSLKIFSRDLSGW